ncbi:27054_t:CDS:1, partial [Racocetra persica]
RETYFKNELIKRLAKRFQINHLLSTPYHPQMNGLVERFNRTLCESLTKLNAKGEEWDTLIPAVLFAYRTAKQ